MKGEIMYIAIRDFTVMWLGYKDIFSGLKDLKINSFELYMGRDLKPTAFRDMNFTTKLGFDLRSKDKRIKVAKELRTQHLSICGIETQPDFAREDRGMLNLQAEIRWAQDACRVASELGVKVVRIESIRQPQQGVSINEYTKITIESIKKILDGTEGLNVSLSMENHRRIGNKREFIRDVLDGVQSPRFGLCLDPGNLYWSGYPLDEVYEIYEEFAPYVNHTHLKNVSYPLAERNKKREVGWHWPDTAATLYDGDIDYKIIVNFLKSSGYDGDLNIEDESLDKFPKEEWPKIIKKDRDFLTSLL